MGRARGYDKSVRVRASPRGPTRSIGDVLGVTFAVKYFCISHSFLSPPTRALTTSGYPTFGRTEAAVGHDHCGPAMHVPSHGVAVCHLRGAHVDHGRQEL